MFTFCDGCIHVYMETFHIWSRFCLRKVEVQGSQVTTVATMHSTSAPWTTKHSGVMGYNTGYNTHGNNRNKTLFLAVKRRVALKHTPEAPRMLISPLRVHVKCYRSSRLVKLNKCSLKCVCTPFSSGSFINNFAFNVMNSGR